MCKSIIPVRCRQRLDGIGWILFLCVAWSVILPSAGWVVASDAPWDVARIEPEWRGVRPLRTIHFEWNEELSEQENGQRLAETMQTLRAGDKLLVEHGRYVMARKFNLDFKGTAEAPIWVVGADPQQMPVITRLDASQNVLNVGESARTEYVCFRQLEFTGGSTLIRFYDCHHLWLDQCHLHHAGAEGITTNSRDTSFLFITRNHFHDFQSPGATGEAMYLGGNHGEAVMSYSVISGNHVHDCGGSQGDGIELKQGSHHNWIVRNEVHDTQYPCIIAYGTAGNGINMIEQNVCYRSGDNTLQVQGEAVVRNNLLIAAEGAGLASTDHQGKTRDLSVVHNTIVSKSRGVNLSSWNDRPGMVLANNAIYTDGGDAVRFPNGSVNVTVAGNVILGRAQGINQGFSRGNGLEDFVDVAWDGSRRSALPADHSPLLGQGDSKYTVGDDIEGRRRRLPPTAGAFARP